VKSVEEASTGYYEGMMIGWLDYSAYNVLVVVSITYISRPRSPPGARAAWPRR
jgi:hypothetical protein